MENIIITAIIVAIVALAILYIVKEKKKGKKCIGCPYCSADGKYGGSCNEDK